MKHLYIILLAATFCGCSSGNQSENTSEDNDEEMEVWTATDDFSLPEGMTAEKASSFPGLTWEIDTLRGVCAPDTLIIWADYNGAGYLTNVRGLSGQPLKELKLSGNEKIESGMPDLLNGVDFKPTAMIVRNPYGTIANMRDTKTEDFNGKAEAITDMIRKFYISAGSSEYMRRSLAIIWEREMSEAMEYGETINPFNNGYAAKFASDKINVTLADPANGIIEVEAYAEDPFTLGHAGWTYWTIEICRETEGFKIKELPAIHRKFDNAD